jgi:hypothetical protein
VSITIEIFISRNSSKIAFTELHISTFLYLEILWKIAEEVSPGSLGQIDFHPSGTYRMSGSQDVGKGETATKAAQSSKLAQPGCMSIFSIHDLFKIPD